MQEGTGKPIENRVEMERIAELFKRCLMEKKFVGDEVREFRAACQEVGYSFDRQS